MPPKSLDAWLAKCIEDELNAVIAWKQQLLTGFKPDPESRFSDDGSNFRSHVRTPPATTTVQLIQVLTSGDIVTAYVSDGIMKVKVRLSGAAVAAFEEDSGGPITAEVRGDVFRLMRFTVVSTPFGPADDFVQLHVDEIEYETLRRGLSDGMPVERDYCIRTLIESTKLLRVPETATVHTAGPPQPVAARLEARSNIPATTTAQSQAPPTKTPNQSQAAPAASPPSSRDNANRTEGPIRRKPPEATLDNDGYELETGLNLSGPVEINPRLVEPHSVVKQAVNTRLLGLLGGTKASAPQTNLGKEDFDLQTQRPLQSQYRAVPVADASPAVHVSTPERTVNTIPESSAIYAESLPHAGDNSTTDHGAKATSQLDAGSVPGGTLSSEKTLFAYARRKIPDAQRKLLDNPASWLPSLPGRQFPKPNVPIELLSRWNTEAAANPPDPVLSQRSRAPSPPKAASLSDVLADSDSDSEDSDDVMEEYPPSPDKNWLPRQAAIALSTAVSSSVGSDDFVADTSRPQSASPQRQHHPELPPSSTFGSVVRGTPLDGELEVAVPHPLPVRNVREKRKAEDALLPLAKRPSLPFPQVLVGPNTHVGSRRSGSNGQPSIPLSAFRGSQEPSTRMSADDSSNLPSQPPNSTAHPHAHAHSPATPAIGEARVQRVTSNTAPEISTQPSPLSSSTFHRSTLDQRPPASQSPLPGPCPRADQPPAPPATSPGFERRSVTSKPVDQFKQRGLFQQPPTGPRSGRPNMYHDTQSMQHLSSGYRDRARELDEARPVRAIQPHRSGTDPPATSSAEASVYEQVVANRQVRNNRLMDVPDPAMERNSSRVSLQQETFGALPRIRASQPTTGVLQSHVVRPASNHLTTPRTWPTLSSRKAWLKANYIATKSGDVGLPAVLEHYQKSFPDDAGIRIDDLLQASRYAFDGVQVTPDMRYIARFQQRSVVTAQCAKSNGEQHPNQDRSTNGRAGRSPPQDPSLLHRRERTKFMNEERRRSWLQTSYVPSKVGTATLADMLERYRQACPEDDHVQLDLLLSAAQSVYRGESPSLSGISTDTLFSSKLETMGTARSRMIARNPKTGENAYEKARRNWILVNYKPDRQGALQLATVMARYRHSCPDDDAIEFEDILRAGQAAWPDHGVTPGMRWTSRASYQPGKSVRREMRRWISAHYAWDPAGRIGVSDMLAAYQAQEGTGSSDDIHNFEEAVRIAFDMQQPRRRNVWHFVEKDDSQSINPTIQKNEIIETCRLWLKARYRMETSGQCSVADMFAAYKQSATANALPNEDTFRAAVSNAFNVGKKKLDKRAFSRLTDHSRHGSHISSSTTSEADTCSSGSEHELMPSDSSEMLASNHQSACSMEELCAKYLAVQPGRGNAFGKPLRKVKQTWNVDVLNWDD